MSCKTSFSPNSAIITCLFLQSEDDGVLVSSLVFGGARDREVALLVVDARTMQEAARAHFHTPSQAPKCLHGWFLPQRSFPS